MKTELKKGQRFYYTGDRANRSTFGTITGIKDHGKFGYSYIVKYDDQRFKGDTKIGYVESRSFSIGPGQRFKTIEQYNEEAEKLRMAYHKKFGF